MDHIAPQPIVDAAPGEVLDVASPPPLGSPWPLTPSAPLGQSFRCRRDGLCSVEVLLAVAPNAGGDLAITLHADDPEGPPIFSRSLPAAGLITERFAHIALPPQDASAGRRYFLTLIAAAPGLAVYTAGLATVGDGAAYRDGQPTAACLVFRTFALATGAHLDEQRRYEELAAHCADLDRELVVARRTIDRLQAERLTLHERLRSIVDRLSPPAAGTAPGA